MRLPDSRAPRRWQSLVALLGIVAAGGLVALTWVVVATGALGTWDASIRTALSHPSATVTTLATVASFTAGAPVAYPLLLLVGSGVAFRARQWMPLLVTGAALVVLGASVYVGKHLIGRPRPRLGTLPRDPEPSFPSGHSTTAVVLVIVILLLTTGSWPSRRRRVALVGAALYIAIVGVSRLLLGVHWFSDVLAGWLLGTVIVAGLALATDALGLNRVLDRRPGRRGWRRPDRDPAFTSVRVRLPG